MVQKRTIYLADLTHKGLVLSSNVFPLSIGLVAAYLLQQRPGQADVQLFKYPEDFSRALETQAPAKTSSDHIRRKKLADKSGQLP